jgi:hypothetical protein
VSGRVIRGNARTVTAVVCDPDQFSLQAAGLGVATNTLSPMSAGQHSSGQRRGFTGDPGYGVNRFAGATDYAVQGFHAPIAPIIDPTAVRLGIGAGVAGQPGLPNTGESPDNAAIGLGFGQLANLGMLGG